LYVVFDCVDRTFLQFVLPDECSNIFCLSIDFVYIVFVFFIFMFLCKHCLLAKLDTRTYFFVRLLAQITPDKNATHDETVLYLNHLPSQLFHELVSMLEPSGMAVFSSVSKHFCDVCKRDEYWVSAAISVFSSLYHGDSSNEISKIVASFVDRDYSHPGYRAYCWIRERTYNTVLIDQLLDSETSLVNVSCVWRKWVFEPLRSHRWTTERRIQVWMQYLENKCTVWLPLPKFYTPGFYDRHPLDPFLLQWPIGDLQLLLGNPELTRVLRGESALELNLRLWKLQQEQRVLQQSLASIRSQIELIETVRRYELRITHSP
jgi:hypothetical protein